MGGFTHLHLHTTYSLLDGQCGIVPLVAKAKSLGMTSLAVTDHGNMFAAKAFYDEARKQGIKPILGVEAYIVDHDHRERHEFFRQHKELKEKRFHLCLHAKNLVAANRPRASREVPRGASLLVRLHRGGDRLLPRHVAQGRQQSEEGRGDRALVQEPFRRRLLA